jgi:glycine C-acetyltransferase
MANPLSYLTDQLNALREAGTYQRLRELESPCDAISQFDGHNVINLASNNYLGLANHPKLVEAECNAAQLYGAGSGAAILTPEDHIISDELNHASIIDGCRLSKAKIHVFRHRDAAHAEEKLAALKDVPGRKLVITDGVFSMDGDIGALPALTELAEKYGAIMMVDDAHASGVLGKNGRGTVDHFGLHGRVHIQVGTLSKAVGVLGGYVCGSRDLIEFLYHRARPFLFSTSHPPAVTAACMAAFDLLEQEPERIEQLWANTRFFQKGLVANGLSIGGSETPITPIMVGEAATAHAFSRELFKEGLYATGIGYPTVPQGKARIRTIVTAAHTKETLEKAIEIITRVAKRMEILK